MTLPMSIIEKENILKGLSRERLTQELAQPTGNFPLFLVASRLKEVEEMEKAAQAQMAQSQNSQQAGSVYERMVTGQPEVSSQGSFAQNRPMSPGVPNVPSEIAAQPAPQPQQQPTQMPMAVAAYGGYAGNLPTMRRARGTASLDSSPITEEQIIASAQAAQEAEAGKRYGYETGRKGRDYDPFRSGLAALWAEKGRQGRELAAMGMPLTKRYGAGDSPYGTGASFVKRYADDGGYVNNLPTVRMQGTNEYQDYVTSIMEYGRSNPALYGLAERELNEVAADQMNLMADSSLINARRANFEQMMGMVLSNAQRDAVLGGTPPLWASPEDPSIRDRFSSVISGLLDGNNKTDLSAIMKEGRNDPRFRAATVETDYSDFAGLEGGVNGDDGELEAITAAPNTDVGARLRAILGSSLGREFDPATGTWKIIDDPTVEGGSPLDVEALLSGGRVWDGEKWVIGSVEEAANIEAKKAAIKAQSAVVDGGPTPDQIDAAENIAIQRWAEGHRRDGTTVPVQVSTDTEIITPDRIVVSSRDELRGGAEGDLLDSLSEAEAALTSRLKSLNNIPEYRSHEQISADSKKLVTDLQVPVTTLINNSSETIEGMKERSKASIAKIEGVMADAKKFAEGGKLPEKLQDQYTNELLMTWGASFANHPDFFAAVGAALDKSIEVKDKYRNDYAKSLNTLVANTTALETMRTELANTTDTASIALAKSAHEFNTGAIAAGQEYEKTAYAANAKRAEIENAMVMASAQSMSAAAQLHAAVHGKPDADERLVKGMMKTRFEELLAADRAAVTEEERRAARAAMDEYFYPVNGEYHASQYRPLTWLKEIILPMEVAKSPSFAGQSYARTDRNSYVSAKGEARKAWEDGVKGDPGAEGVASTFKALYGPDVEMSYENLQKMDQKDFERAFLINKYGPNIRDDWAQYFNEEYLDTRNFQLDPVED